MKIVIDIPKKTFEEMQERTIITCGESFAQKLVKYIKNGTSLPEHHGDLIDRDELVPYCKFRGYCWGNKCDRCSDYAVDYSDIKNAPTIIEGSES